MQVCGLNERPERPGRQERNKKNKGQHETRTDLIFFAISNPLFPTQNRVIPLPTRQERKHETKHFFLPNERSSAVVLGKGCGPAGCRRPIDPNSTRSKSVGEAGNPGERGADWLGRTPLDRHRGQRARVEILPGLGRESGACSSTNQDLCKRPRYREGVKPFWRPQFFDRPYYYIRAHGGGCATEPKR